MRVRQKSQKGKFKWTYIVHFTCQIFYEFFIKEKMKLYMYLINNIKSNKVNSPFVQAQVNIIQYSSFNIKSRYDKLD